MFTCKRLVEFRILTERRERSVAGAPEAEQPGVAQVELPKIQMGMKKSEVLSAFGKPDLVESVDSQFLILNYTNEKFCINRCTIGFKNERVYKFDGFRSEYTDLLETKSVGDQLRSALGF